MLYLVNLSTVKSHVFDDRAPHLDSLLRYAPSLVQMRLPLPLVCVYHVIALFVYNVTLDKQAHPTRDSVGRWLAPAKNIVGFYLSISLCPQPQFREDCQAATGRGDNVLAF